jgi:hypothetical protein
VKSERRIIFLFLTLAISPFAAAQQPSASKKITFDSDAVGFPPAGFEFERTGQGAEGKWVVRDDKEKPGNRVLVQESADATDYRFPLAILKEVVYRDVTLTVRARPISGEVDQGFGPSGATGTRTTTTSPGATLTRTTARSTTRSGAGGGRSRTSRSR